MVLFFDEFDAIGKDRASVEEHGEIKRVVNSFLQILDSFRSDTITIAATNHEGLLDSALWRRFDEIVSFERPSQEATECLLRINLRQIGLQHDVNLRDFARKLDGLSHADIERVARDAVKQMLLTEPGPVSCAVLGKTSALQIRRSRIAAKSLRPAVKVKSRSVKASRRQES
jgi:SpoVK/Ycf46/Vps4 family AAA+-type ATPase